MLPWWCTRFWEGFQQPKKKYLLKVVISVEQSFNTYCLVMVGRGFTQGVNHSKKCVRDFLTL